MASTVDIIIEVQDSFSAKLNLIEAKLRSLNSLVTKGQAEAISMQKKLLSNRFDKTLNSLLRGVQNSSKAAFSSIDTVIDGLDKKISVLKRNTNKNMLAMGLSFLFTGMAIKRLADQALTAIINTYRQAIGDSGEFNVLTNQLAANWAFFKFSLMDALMQSGLFETLIGWVISLIQWINQIPPEYKTAIVVGIVGAAAIGGLMMIIGQFGLGILGIKAAFELMGISGVVAINNIKIAFGVLLPWFLAFLTAWELYKAAPFDLAIGFSWLVRILLWVGQTIVTAILLPFEAIIKTVLGFVNIYRALTGQKPIKFSLIGTVDNMFDSLQNANNQRMAELQAQRAMYNSSQKPLVAAPDGQGTVINGNVIVNASKDSELGTLFKHTSEEGRMYGSTGQ